MGRLLTHWENKERERQALVPPAFAEPQNVRRLRVVTLARAGVGLVVVALIVALVAGDHWPSGIVTGLVIGLAALLAVVVVLGARALRPLADAEREHRDRLAPPDASPDGSPDGTPRDA